MGFRDSVLTCLRKYAVFQGRAPRSEFWFFILFQSLLQLAVVVLFDGHPQAIDGLSLIVGAVLFVPLCAAGCRRLHDTGRSGWWQLAPLVPVVGALVLLVFFCQRGTTAGNRFGHDAVTSVAALA